MLTVVLSYLRNTGITSRSHLDDEEFAFVFELFPHFQIKAGNSTVSVSQTTCGPLQVPRGITPASWHFLGALEDNELQFES